MSETKKEPSNTVQIEKPTFKIAIGNAGIALYREASKCQVKNPIDEAVR